MLYIRLFLILLVLNSLSAIANSRSPAVEDFIGIEVEENQVAPRGTESLFNLEQDVQSIQNQSARNLNGSVALEDKNTSNFNNVTKILSMGILIGLPFIIWFLLMFNLKKKATLESASNIEILDKHRRRREEHQIHDEDNKKAS